MGLTSGCLPECGQTCAYSLAPVVVNDVKPSSLPISVLKDPAGVPQHLLSLSSIEDDGLGEELQVVWEIEPGAKRCGEGPAARSNRL